MHSHAMHCHQHPGGSSEEVAFDPRALWALMSGQRGGGGGGGGRGRGSGGPRHRGRGFGPPFGPNFGPGGGGFRGRARRGDVRAALLVLLDEEPRNGYGLMQEIERRSEGAWRPSPGSVYPALQQLEDEGLVRAEEASGRRQFVLTDAGREHVEAHREELAEPWAAVAGGVDEGLSELRSSIGQVGAAVMQIAYAGTKAQVAEARRVLADTRRALYRILAEETEDGAEEDPAGGEPAGEA
jgi:DNA-binding PadR family transcriptional regulator